MTLDSVIHISPAEAEARRAAGEVELVDVREHAEWRLARVPGSRLVPLTELESRWSELSALGRPLAFLCRVGQRSALAAALADRRGLAAVNVAGGMERWSADGLAVERGPAGP